MDEFIQLTALCAKLGAARPQAEAMARQLMKRADQLAKDRAQTREAAMAYLLNLLVQGRNGAVSAEFKPPQSRRSE